MSVLDKRIRATGMTGIMLSWFLLVIAAAGTAWGLATEVVGNEPLTEGNYVEWQDTDIIPVINHTSRVYHRWVNGNEHFYYRGNADALNDILQKFAAVRLDIREVIIRPGPMETKTFQEQSVAYDWQLHLLTGLAGHDRPPGSRIEFGEMNPTLTICVGSGNLNLEQIRIPPGITVVYPDGLRERYLKELKNDDSHTRGLAAYRLAELEPYNTDNIPLIAQLLDDEGNAAHFTAGALGRMGTSAESALPAIKRALKNQSDTNKTRLLEAIQEIENAEDTTAAAEAHRAILEEIARFRKTCKTNRSLRQDQQGNLVLFISNQSFGINPVDITVHIDGKKGDCSIITESFYQEAILLKWRIPMIWLRALAWASRCMSRAILPWTCSWVRTR